MPISIENRALYPANWREIRARIQARAGDRCEKCAVPNGAFRIRGTEEWTTDLMQVETWICCDEQKVTRIVCTTAHVDHTIENYEDDNLRFWCQRCHLAHDMDQHRTSAYMSRRRGKALELF